MNGDIYDQYRRHIYVEPEDVWPHVVHIKAIPQHSVICDVEFINSLSNFSHFGVCPYYVFDGVLCAMFYLEMQGVGAVPYSYLIVEVLTKGGVFLREAEEIISWLLEDRVYLIESLKI